MNSYKKFFLTTLPVQYKIHGYSRYIKLNMDDKNLNAQIAKHFYPIDFSNIPGFPNLYRDQNDIYDYFRIFYGHGDSTIHHVIDFIGSLVEFNIVYEDNMMQMFASTFAERVYCWFSKDLPNKHNSSLSSFLSMFLKWWCGKGSCMVVVERHIKKYFTNMLPEIEYHEEIQEPPRIIVMDHI